MKQRYLSLVCLVLWASASSAQIDPNSNGIGIYADLGGLTNEVEVEVGKPLEAYLLLTRPSGAGALGAWECNVVVPDNVKIWGWNLPAPGTVCVSTPPAFCVGIHPEVVYENTTLLVTFILTPLDSSPAQFYIEEFPNTQGVTKPRYIDCLSSGGTWMVDMNPYPSSDMAAAFTVNPSALPVTTKSWGDLKALYR